MKTHWLCALAALVVTEAFAAPFRNLGFDEADLSGINPGGGLTFGSATALLPGWEKSFGDTPIFYNSSPTGLGYAELIPAQNQEYSSPLPVQGLYSFLIATPLFSTGAIVDQQGDVPVDAKLLSFINYGAPFELRLNGSVIPVTYFESQFPSDATQCPTGSSGCVGLCRSECRADIHHASRFHPIPWPRQHRILVRS